MRIKLNKGNFNKLILNLKYQFNKLIKKLGKRTDTTADAVMPR